VVLHIVGQEAQGIHPVDRHKVVEAVDRRRVVEAVGRHRVEEAVDHHMAEGADSLASHHRAAADVVDILAIHAEALVDHIPAVVVHNPVAEVEEHCHTVEELGILRAEAVDMDRTSCLRLVGSKKEKESKTKGPVYIAYLPGRGGE
jgi:hypothetical protein